MLSSFLDHLIPPLCYSPARRAEESLVSEHIALTAILWDGFSDFSGVGQKWVKAVFGEQFRLSSKLLFHLYSRYYFRNSLGKLGTPGQRMKLEIPEKAKRILKSHP